jgi:hypothetical protein
MTEIQRAAQAIAAAANAGRNVMVFTGRDLTDGGAGVASELRGALRGLHVNAQTAVGSFSAAMPADVASSMINDTSRNAAVTLVGNGAKWVHEPLSTHPLVGITDSKSAALSFVDNGGLVVQIG